MTQPGRYEYVGTYKHITDVREAVAMHTIEGM
jgi:hypothetical protein